MEKTAISYLHELMKEVASRYHLKLNMLQSKQEKHNCLEWVSIFLRAIVVQTYSATECVNSPTCRAESPASLFYRFSVLQTIGPTWKYDYRYGGQEQCIVSPTFCRTIDVLVEISV